MKFAKKDGICYTYIDNFYAAVVELVDTLDSKSDVPMDVPVQVRPAVPQNERVSLGARLLFLPKNGRDKAYPSAFKST